VLTPSHPSADRAAGGQWSDGFESNPSATWSFSGEGDSSGRFATAAPHSGSTYASISEWYPGWSSVGRSVRITPATVHTPKCGLSAWMATTAYRPRVNVEVIDPATWTYIALYQVTLSGQGYKNYAVGSWRATKADVFLRFSVLANDPNAPAFANAQIDDVVISCSY
jgi:hypothetical protein